MGIAAIRDSSSAGVGFEAKARRHGAGSVERIEDTWNALPSMLLRGSDHLDRVQARVALQARLIETSDIGTSAM